MNKDNGELCYKVVTRLYEQELAKFGNKTQERLVRHTGAFARYFEYRIGRKVNALKTSLKAGYGIFTFSTKQEATYFADHSHHEDEVLIVYEAQGFGRLPKKEKCIAGRWYYTRAEFMAAIAQLVNVTCDRWDHISTKYGTFSSCWMPDGTVMYRQVKLIKEVY